MLWLQFGFSGCKVLHKQNHYVRRSVCVKLMLSSCIWKPCSICWAKSKARCPLILIWTSWKAIINLTHADKKRAFCCQTFELFSIKVVQIQSRQNGQLPKMSSFGPKHCWIASNQACSLQLCQGGRTLYYDYWLPLLKLSILSLLLI